MDPISHNPSEKQFRTWLHRHGLQPEAYYLIVGRFVPENNFETMIREFMRSDTTRSLAIITTANDSFLNQLEEKLHFKRDARIRFTGTVYDREVLHVIRQSAFAYLHGHEVGGTNPSLLEAMGSTNLNLLLDVGFNREVGGDAALYWNKKEGSLSRLISAVEALPEEKRLDYGRRAKERMLTLYSWEGISRQYEMLFTGGTKEREHTVDFLLTQNTSFDSIKREFHRPNYAGRRYAVARRMTWNEIIEQYPHQFVYLVDIRREVIDGKRVETAEVIHATPDNDDDEYIRRSVRGECVERYTDMEEIVPMGALSL